MSQLRQHQDDLDRLDVNVKVITFDNDVMAMAYVKATDLQWPLLFDSDLNFYKAYGMGNASWWSLYRPASIVKYLKLIFQGKGPGKPGKDWQQLGGDVLIDPEGVVRMHYVSADPHDRPTVEEILDVIEQDK